MSHLIEAYLAEFERHLGFDRRLSRRVRDEVESHISETLEHDANEEQAIARFGDPRILSRSFVEVALPQRAKATAVILGLLAAVTFALMKLRSLWYDFDQDQTVWAAQLATLDRTGFILGMLVALFALWNIYKRRPNIDHAILAIHAAMISFSVSIFASLGRAMTFAGPEPLIWLTGSLEVIGILAICWNLQLTVRHAGIVHALRTTEAP